MFRKLSLRFRMLLCAVIFSTGLPVDADSPDALIVLTYVGYLVGAADGCKIDPDYSNQLSSGIAIAINGGNYGDPAEAHILLNNARQMGVAQASAGKVNCSKISSKVRQYVQSLLSD